MPSKVFQSRNSNLELSLEDVIQVFKSKPQTEIGLIKEIISTTLEVYFMYEKRKWIMK